MYIFVFWKYHYGSSWEEMNCLWRDKNKDRIRGYSKGPGEIHGKPDLKQCMRIQKSEMLLSCTFPKAAFSIFKSPHLWSISVFVFWVEWILPLWRSHFPYHSSHNFSHSLQIKLPCSGFIDITQSTILHSENFHFISSLYPDLIKVPQSTCFAYVERHGQWSHYKKNNYKKK